MMQCANQIHLPGHQTGSSLVVSMIMLVVLMLMGVGAIVVSNTQYRMAGNFQFQNQAMASAESALSQAELWVTANVAHPEFAARVSGGHYPIGTGPDPYTMPWTDATSERVGGLDSQRYIIEVMGANRYLPASSVKTCPGYTLSGPCSRVNVYRITARGTSARGSVKIVQSVFTVQVSI
jgi:Tfp pilus assembly protein PilX